MSDARGDSHAGLLAGMTSALPLGVVLGLSVFENLTLGIGTMLVIGTACGLLTDLRFRGR